MRQTRQDSLDCTGDVLSEKSIVEYGLVAKNLRFLHVTYSLITERICNAFLESLHSVAISKLPNQLTRI